MKDKIVESLQLVDFSEVKIPMIVVYKKPVDYPESYVCRVFDMNKPTNIILIKKSLEDCRNDIKAAGFYTCIDRDFQDVQCIVETWM